MPVYAADERSYVLGGALLVDGRGADIDLLAEAAERVFQKFGKDVDEKAPDEEGDGDRRHDEGKDARILHGGDDEEDGDRRGDKLQKVFGHLDEAVQLGARLVHQVDAVTYDGDEDGKRERRADESEQRSADAAVFKTGIVIHGVYGVCRVPRQKDAAQYES